MNKETSFQDKLLIVGQTDEAEEELSGDGRLVVLLLYTAAASTEERAHDDSAYIRKVLDVSGLRLAALQGIAGSGNAVSIKCQRTVHVLVA